MISILITMSITGCIESDESKNPNDKNEIPDAKYSDLGLIIKMDKTTSNLTNKLLDVNVTLSNIKDYDVKIEKSFQVGTWLKVEITSPNNETLEAALIQEELENEKVVFKAKKEIYLKFSIFSINYLNENGLNYNWTVGKYTISFRYLITEPDVISNEIILLIF
jgi:hypothetical protein